MPATVFPCTFRSSMSYNEKATVGIDGDGNVLKCAKGAGVGECGFVKGAAICAKCGATPVEMKMVPVSQMDEEEVVEEVDEEMPQKMKKKSKKKKGYGMNSPEEVEEDLEDEDMDAKEAKGIMCKAQNKMVGEACPECKGDCVSMGYKQMNVDAEDDEEMMEDDEEMMEDEMPSKSKKSSKRVKGKAAMAMMDEDDEDDETEMPTEESEDTEEVDMEDEEVESTDEDEDEDEMKSYGRRKKIGKKAIVDADMEDDDEELEDDEMEEDEEDEEEGDMAEKSFSTSDTYWEEVRRSRINSLGIKSADLGAFGYLCALERKAYPGSSPVCDDCPGGCVAEKGLPGILHAEGVAEQMFDGVVVDSGYSPDADMFVVDVQAKDGSVKEVFVDGTSAEIMGFHKLDISEFEQKSDYSEYKLIDFSEAAEIAVKSIDGQVVAVEPDVFEGFDTYAVEIEGFDGKSYDVFVSLDGEVLGYDRYEQDEALEIEAEAAEIALKRAFSEEKRAELAKSGMALEDGSFPIVGESDLRNAIQAYGRAKNKDIAKKHIMKRAKALKLESLIPANWIAGTSEKSEKEVDDASFMASLVEFQLLEDQIDSDN